MYKKKIELDVNKFPVGFHQNDICEVAKKHNLPNNYKITKALISQIIASVKHHVPYGQGKYFPYQLLKIEDEVFNIIIAVSKCHHPIIVSNVLQLINDLISNTEYKVKLNSFKSKSCGVTEEDDTAAVGKGYWSGFIE